MTLLRPFALGFLMVALVSSNVTFIAERDLGAAAGTSFIIQLVWTFGVGTMARSTTRAKVLYALGGAAGNCAGILIGRWVVHG